MYSKTNFYSFKDVHGLKHQQDASAENIKDGWGCVTN